MAIHPDIDSAFDRPGSRASCPRPSPGSSEGGSFGESLKGLLASVDESAGDANNAVANMLRRHRRRARRDDRAAARRN